jgi:hypothetical protein
MPCGLPLAGSYSGCWTVGMQLLLHQSVKACRFGGVLVFATATPLKTSSMPLAA